MQSQQPYPTFPSKRTNKQTGKNVKRLFPVETHSEYKTRTKVISAYVASLKKISSAFARNAPKPIFVANVGGQEVEVTKKDIGKLFTLIGKDIKDLAGFFEVAVKNAGKTRKSGVGFSKPTFLSQKIVDFFADAQLGYVFTESGVETQTDLKTLLDNMINPDSVMFRIGSSSSIMILFSIYNMVNQLNKNANRNADVPEGGKLDKNWLGADDAMKTVFSDEIRAQIQKSRVQFEANREAARAWGRDFKDGDVRLVKASGKAAKGPKKGSDAKETQRFYLFTPDNFRWNDVSSAFVTPNARNDLRDSVVAANQYADDLVPAKDLTGDQAAQVTAYEESYKALASAGSDKIDLALKAGDIAAEVTGSASINDVLNVNPALYARAVTTITEAALKVSKRGLKKAVGLP